MKGFCGHTDDIDHQVGVGEHGHVTAGDLMRSGAHAFGDDALQFGLHGAVLGGHDVRTGLRHPGDTIELLCEQVRGRGKVSCPDELLLLLRQVARECVEAVLGGDHLMSIRLGDEAATGASGIIVIGAHDRAVVIDGDRLGE